MEFPMWGLPICWAILPLNWMEMGHICEPLLLASVCLVYLWHYLHKRLVDASWSFKRRFRAPICRLKLNRRARCERRSIRREDVRYIVIHVISNGKLSRVLSNGVFDRKGIQWLVGRVCSSGNKPVIHQSPSELTRNSYCSVEYLYQQVQCGSLWLLTTVFM